MHEHNLTPPPADNSRINEVSHPYTHHLTDLGNARRLVSLFGDRLRYIPSHGWYTFTGSHWHPADPDYLLSLASSTLEDHFEQLTLLSDQNSELCEHALSHLARSASLPRLRAMLQLARALPGISLPHSALDANPELLNLLNGTLNLRTSELHPHAPTDYLTRLIPIDYDPLTIPSHWLSFLDRLTNSDATLHSYLQRAIGTTLFGSSPESTAFLLTGQGHRAHQLFLSTLRALLGDYSAHSLALQRRDLSPSLLTARLLTLESSSFPHACDPTILSALITGNPIIHPRTNTTYQPHATLWLSTPELPALPDRFASLREHFQPLPLSLDLTGEEAAQLSAQLHLALPAILFWAIQGYQLSRTEPSILPPCLLAITATFRENRDSLSCFLAQECTHSPEAAIPARSLYDAYLFWNRASGEPPLTLTSFGTRISTLGYKRSRKSQCILYLGISLNSTYPVESVEIPLANPLHAQEMSSISSTKRAEMYSSPAVSVECVHSANSNNSVSAINPISDSNLNHSVECVHFVDPANALMFNHPEHSITSANPSIPDHPVECVHFVDPSIPDTSPNLPSNEDSAHAL